MTRLLLALSLFAFVASGAMAQPLATPSAQLSATPEASSLGGGPLALYQQTTGGGTSGYFLGENFEEANDGFDSLIADDFTVPAGQAWSVTRFQLRNFYSVADGGTFTQPPSFNVVVWENDPTDDEPGVEVQRFDEVVPTSDGGAAGTLGDLVIDLPSAVELSAGTYWFAVQANQDFTANGTRFLWYSSGETFGFTAKVFNVGGGFTTLGTCNVDWGDINGAECGRDGTGDSNLIFEVYGGFEVVTALEPVREGTFSLVAPSPNPFRDAARASFSVDATQHVTATLVDLLGREVRTLYDGTARSGDSVSLDVQAGSLRSGVYILRLVGERGAVSRPVTLVR